jgi:hypothetical protein
LFLLSLIASGPVFADRQQDPQLGALLEQALAAGACFETSSTSRSGSRRWSRN